MDNPIRILILEHDEHDVELLDYELRKAGVKYIAKIVASQSEFEAELRTFNAEIILSDYSLPSFDGLTACDLTQKTAPETPFILVSGTIGEENAVELIKRGATDYVLKDRMYQVAPKITRALQEKKARKEKVLAQERLRQSQQQLQKIIDHSLDLICSFDQEGKFVHVGAASERTLGYLPAELIGRHWWEFVHPDDLESTMQFISLTVKNGQGTLNFENRYIRKNGTPVPMYWSGRWDANEKLAYCIGRDATERKAAEEAIKRSEKRFRTILEHSADGLCMLSEHGNILEISPTGQKILGYGLDELLNRSWFDFVHESDAAHMKEVMQNVIGESGNIHRIECQSKRPDHSYRWLEITFQNELLEPSVGAIIAHFRDITEKKLAEMAIREREEKYRNLFDLSPFPMWLFDVNTFRFMDVNEAAVRHYGYSREEFLSMTIKDIRPKEDIQKVTEMVEHTKHSGAFSRGIFTHVKKNGERIFVDIQSNLVDYSGIKARLVLANDISGRVRYVRDIEEMNKRLREIAWIQSHHVRAPVARIKSLIDMIKNTNTEEDNTFQLLDYIAMSVDELDSIIRDIVTKTEEVEKPNHQ